MHICHSHLEIGRHEGVVHNHHYVFVVLVDKVRTRLNVNNLHHGVAGSLDPHQLHRQRNYVISLHQRVRREESKMWQKDKVLLQW